MKAPFKLALNSALLAGMLLATTAASATDKDLLDTLLKNGALTKAQHEKLVSQSENKEKKTTSKGSSILDMDWASRIKMSGDMRVRQEFRNSDFNGVEKSRQRIRARLAINAKINDEVDAGARLVTGGNATSANQDLGGSFGGKDVFFDLAFIDWHPEFASGAHLIAGKMKKPWFSTTDLVWDSDVNPEGLALTYERKVGPVALKATAGYFLLEDGITSDNAVTGDTLNNNGFSDDMNMYHAGISGKMKITDTVKASLGYNAYIYNNIRNDFNSTAAGGTTVGTGSSGYRLHEVAGAIDIKTGIVPIKVYGQYVINTADVRNPTTGNIDNQDSAWLAGVAAKYGAFKLDYNYRDTQRDGIMPLFNDSDFNDGNESVRGHKLKASYKISKNFSIGAAYFAADGYDGNNRDTAQIDLKAKF